MSINTHESLLEEARRVPAYLEQNKNDLEYDEIIKIRNERASWLCEKKYEKFREAYSLPFNPVKKELIANQSIVKIGNPKDLSEEEGEILDKALNGFIPWKKGPFDIYGRNIDSEWRSDIKWDRLEPFVAPMEGKRVADIGCNNGYFMFRMLEHKPEFVVGFDPFCKYWFNFEFMKRVSGVQNLYYELLGVEHVDLYPRFFDTIFCLGILYHHQDPVGLLRKMRRSLRYKGKVIIDCQGIPGEDPVALSPRRRYAGATGIWFLPTYNCLVNWLHRSDYKEITPIFSGELTEEEQRSTEWAPIRSLGDFLDAKNKERTVEGYPAPHRFYLMAR